MLKENIKKIKQCVTCVGYKDDRGVLNKHGSGFIVNPKGYIVTCDHVIKDLPDHNVFVGLEGEDELLKAKKIYSDMQKDLAIIKVDKEHLNCVELGDYSEFEEGDKIAFCGYPLQVYQPTTNRGIVSAKGTNIIRDFDFNVIQIDGSINRGNSGGPLFLQENGKVIGIVNARYGSIGEELNFIKNLRQQGGVSIGGVNLIPTLQRMIEVMDDTLQVGIGYAVPVDYIKNKLDNLNTSSG